VIRSQVVGKSASGRSRIKPMLVGVGASAAAVAAAPGASGGVGVGDGGAGAGGAAFANAVGSGAAAMSLVGGAHARRGTFTRFLPTVYSFATSLSVSLSLCLPLHPSLTFCSVLLGLATDMRQLQAAAAWPSPPLAPLTKRASSRPRAVLVAHCTWWRGRVCVWHAELS
jgi:hypothetical protein